MLCKLGKIYAKMCSVLFGENVVCARANLKQTSYGMGLVWFHVAI